jgi:hypothetical protein
MNVTSGAAIGNVDTNKLSRYETSGNLRPGSARKILAVLGFNDIFCETGCEPCTGANCAKRQWIGAFRHSSRQLLDDDDYKYRVRFSIETE